MPLFLFAALAPLLLVVSLLGLPCYGSPDDDKDRPTAQSLRATLLYGQAAYPAPNARSVPLAFGLSAAVPGLGQAYNRQWLKAAVAVGGELAVIFAYSSWRSRGMDGRDAYQAFAHRSWSPVRYAYWLNDYVSYLNSLPDGHTVDVSPINVAADFALIDLSDPDSWSQADRLEVQSLILEIQAVENAVYHPETGASFSHKLPLFGEQQYYELVGKYFQFAPGWEDYSFVVRDGIPRWVDENGKYLVSIDPEATASDGSKPNVSPLFRQYAHDHAQANDFLRRASRVTILLIVNHVLAAVDAAVFTKLHNGRLRTALGIAQDVRGIQATATVRWML